MAVADDVPTYQADPFGLKTGATPSPFTTVFSGTQMFEKVAVLR